MDERTVRLQKQISMLFHDLHYKDKLIDKEKDVRKDTDIRK